MKIYEIVPKGFSSVIHAVKQGKYYRGWSTSINKPYDSLWLQSECEVLPAITEEFLPTGTHVYTSHGKEGCIIIPQKRDESGVLHPAKVHIYSIKTWVPIWEDQLIKAIK